MKYLVMSFDYTRSVLSEAYHQESYCFDLLSSLLQGVELGPLEITINSLAKSIESEQGEIGELQQMWLRDQSQLVHLTKDKDSQSRDVDNLKKQLTILSQKKLRIESEFAQI